MTRTRSAILNYLSSLALTGMTMATGLVATPLLLRWLGKERFGASRAATDVMGYLVLLQFGYTAASLPLLAEALNRGNISVLRQTLAMGIRYFVKVTVLALFAGVILAFYIGKIVPVSASLHSDLKRAAFISLIGLVLLPLTPLRTLADVGQEAWVINVSLLLQAIVITSVALIAAKAGWGISGQTFATIIGLVIFQAILIVRARRRIPDLLNVAWTEPDSKEVKQRLSALQMWSFLLQIAVTASFLTDNVMIGYFMGATTVTSFFLTQRLIAISQTQIQGIAGATWAGLTELHHAGHAELFRQRYLEILRLIVVTALTILTPIVAFNKFFIRIWVPSTGYAGDLVTLVASINALFYGVTALWAQLLNSTGRLRQYAAIGVSVGIVNFVASVLATKFFGICGPLFGTLIGFLAVGMWAYPLRMRRDFHVSLSASTSAILRPTAEVLPFALGLWWFAQWLAPHQWRTLVPSIVTTELLFIAFMWCVVFEKSERAFWQSRFSGAFAILRRRYISAPSKA